jgi:hypothetical protein
MLEHRHRHSRRLDLPRGLHGGAEAAGGEQEGLRSDGTTDEVI